MVDAFPVKIVVSVHHAFRPIGGAGCIHQAEQVVRLSGMQGRRGMIAEERGGVALGRVVHENLRRKICNRGGELRICEYEFGLSVGRDVLDLVGGEAKVDGQEYRTEMTDREGKFEK